jgi:RNA recognition motif-containing protein
VIRAAWYAPAFFFRNHILTFLQRGFGFVTFCSQDQAECAIREMHDKELDGRRLRVNAAYGTFFSPYVFRLTSFLFFSSGDKPERGQSLIFFIFLPLTYPSSL